MPYASLRKVLVDVLGVGKAALINLQVEVTHGLFHARIVEGTCLVIVELVRGFSNPESERFITESQVLCWNVTVEEDIDTLTNTVWEGDNAVYCRLTVENADVI